MKFLNWSKDTVSAMPPSLHNCENSSSVILSPIDCAPEAQAEVQGGRSGESGWASGERVACTGRGVEGR